MANRKRPFERPLDLEDQIDMALEARNPLELLTLASSVLSFTDPRSFADPTLFPDEPGMGGGRGEVIDVFLRVDSPTSSALLTALVPLSLNRFERARIERELDTRHTYVPPWLRQLRSDPAEIERTVEMSHVLRDGDNILIGMRLPSGQRLTVVCYVDFNSAVSATDGYVVSDPIEEFIRLAEPYAGADTRFIEIDPADARARITGAIGRGALATRPHETETWPVARSIVEWAASLMPSGGRDYEPPDWDDDIEDALVVAFFESAHAPGSPEVAGRAPGEPATAAAPDPDLVILLSTMFGFVRDFGSGDPLLWSPTVAELALCEWFAHGVVADRDLLAKLPDLLRAWVHFAHDATEIPAEYTAETLATISELEPAYLKVVSRVR